MTEHTTISMGGMMTCRSRKNGKFVKNKEEDYVGKVFKTNKGGDCVVLKYNNSNDVIVKFIDDREFTTSARLVSLRKGNVKNFLSPTLFGVGYLGAGKYVSSVNGVKTLAYVQWHGMMRRGYCPKLKSKHLSYVGVEVCEEWHNFQVFAEWYVNHRFYGLGYHLDKDLLVKGNKVYSPDTCCLIPVELNTFLNDNPAVRKSLPLGVTKRTIGNNYQAAMSIENTRKHLGYYKTPEEAHQAYKKAKEAFVKERAKFWMGSVEESVIEALMNWKVT